jgi:hypothetical protein
MRLSEKYGRWGIVCGGTIGQGSHSNRLASEGVNVVSLIGMGRIVYRGDVTPL